MSTKEKFNTAVHKRVTESVAKLMEDTPELDGIVVTLLYAEDLGSPSPEFLLFGDGRNPQFIARMGEQVCKLSQTLISNLGQHFADAVKLRQQLQKEIDDRQLRLATQNTEDRAEETPADTGGAGNTSSPA